MGGIRREVRAPFGFRRFGVQGRGRDGEGDGDGLGGQGLDAGGSPWLMKAAGPSQSWAHCLRVEYMMLKSFSPERSSASSCARSSAMQPTSSSSVSFFCLRGVRGGQGGPSHGRDPPTHLRRYQVRVETTRAPLVSCE